MVFRILGMLVLALAVQAPAVPQTGIRNGGFEEGQNAGVPVGWTFPEGSSRAGYHVTVSAESPRSGAAAALLEREPGAKGAGYGTLEQHFDAAPLRNRRIILRASVRTDTGAGAYLSIRVNRAGEQPRFEYDRRIALPMAWMPYRAEADVPGDATEIVVSFDMEGSGKAWLDDVSMESVALVVRPAAPPRPFEGRGLDNVVAFTRLLGYVRYFHPSDEAAGADWDLFAIEGIGEIESAPSAETLARALEQRFRTVAPTLRVFTGAPGPLPEELKPSPVARRVRMWKHHGIGIPPQRGIVARPLPLYRSERWTADLVDGKLPAGMANPAEPLVVDLGGGVKAAVPLALWSDGTGTLPRPTSAPRAPAPYATSAADRATRLADIALAWNVFQHFFPYFDVVKTDWPASLRQALVSAATDDERTFGTTLRKLVADLHDGHGAVSGAVGAPARLPLAWDWIEGELVVTEVGPGVTAVHRGDIVKAIDGKPAAAALAAEERLISAATPQYLRYRALGETLRGPAGEATLTLVTGGVSREARINRASGAPVSEPRPDPISEIRPGIFYVDPERLSDSEFNAALPRLSAAKGIVFEMRGYPRLSPIFLHHLIDSPVQSARWLIPLVTRPDREGMTFEDSGPWNLAPIAPRLAAPVAFVTDGRAISYAESCMGIVEHYKLGAIVGGPTAGTNGDVNPFALPGGYSIRWTGMKVLKQDGSRHHGVGIQPTIPVSRTIAGVREGRDEFLERAIDSVRRQP